MVSLNKGYDRVHASYLFSKVAECRNAFTERTGRPVIRIDIGDAKLPQSPTVSRAMALSAHRQQYVTGYTKYQRTTDKVKEILHEAGYDRFNGYGDEQGNKMLRQAIAGEYQRQGINVSADEIFVSDGAKCDCGNIQTLFSLRNIVAVQDPAYPVYVDSNVIAGRGGKWDKKKGMYSGLNYMPCNEENNFLCEPSDIRHGGSWQGDSPGLIYLCSPNNPTGAVMYKAKLKRFVDYAIKNGSLIMFDAAYSAFIDDPTLPRSILEIPGAKDCSIEFQSFSKSHGFTGTRLGWIVVPKRLQEGKLNRMWNRRSTTFFNGADNIAQAGGLVALLHPTARKECAANVKTYMKNALMIRECIEDKGFETVTGGIDSPYVWFNTGMDSWKFLGKSLEECGVSCTPGSGFGPSGAGYARLSAFALPSDVERACDSISKNLKI